MFLPWSSRKAGFGDVRAARSIAPEQVAEPDNEFAELVVGDFLPAVDQRADVQVILQIPADARQIVDRFDAGGLQLRGRAYS